MKIYLVRHAESLGNADGNLASVTDFPLTEKGELQARNLGKSLKGELEGKHITAYSSPLLRAVQTTKEIFCSAGIENVPIMEVECLKEMDLGKLEGIPFQQLPKEYPEVDLASKLSELHAPEGECYQDVKNRCEFFLRNFVDKAKDDENIIVVSHGITLRVMINLILKRPDKDVDYLNWIENTAQTVFEYDILKKKYQLLCLNDFSHLGELKTKNFDSWGTFAGNTYLETLRGSVEV